MNKNAATELLRGEVDRLRSGAGGHGGGSPQALALAEAIETVLDHAVSTSVPHLDDDEIRSLEVALDFGSYFPQPDTSRDRLTRILAKLGVAF